MTEFYHEEEAELHKKITKFADEDKEYGYIEHTVDGKVYRFPKRAMLWYMFGNMSGICKKLPEYNAFCDRDMKLPNDNKYHSDCILGAGFELDEYYNNDNLVHAMHEAKYALQEEFSHIIDVDAYVLANSLPSDVKVIKFMVYDHKVIPKGSWSNISIWGQKKLEVSNDYRRMYAICIPTAGMEYDEAAREAHVIITETGGKLCHMATVSREMGGKIVIRVKDALDKFPRFCQATLHIDTGKITYDRY